MIELENDNLESVISDHDKVFVLFGATWCGGCRIVKPKVKKASAAQESVHFIYVDAEKSPQSRKLAEVSNLPTYASFKSGQLLSQGQGNKWENIQEVIDEIASH